MYEYWATIYDRIVGDESRQTWCTGIVHQLAQLGVHSGTVLDLGAGTGIGGRALTAAGNFTVTSLDRSENMLARLSCDGGSTILADMSDFTLPPNSYDIVVCGFDSLNYLDRRELEGCLRSVRRTIKPSGYMIFDYSSPKLLQDDWRDHTFSEEIDGLTFESRISFSFDGNRSTSIVSLLSDGEVQWQEIHHQYSFDPHAMYQLAKGQGFTILSIRDLGGESFSSGARTHVYTLRSVEINPKT